MQLYRSSYMLSDFLFSTRKNHNFNLESYFKTMTLPSILFLSYNVKVHLVILIIYNFNKVISIKLENIYASTFN